MKFRQLSCIALIVFIDLVGFSIIFPLFPDMLAYYLPREGAGSLLGKLFVFLTDLVGDRENAGYYTMVLFGGVLGALYSLLQFVFSPIWGRMSDRIGRKKVLLVTTAGTALSYVVWVFSGSFLLLVFARAIGGVMAGNISVATAAVADVTKPENRAKAMGIIGACFGLGFMIGPAIGGICSYWDLSAGSEVIKALSLNPFSLAALVALVLSSLNFLFVCFKFDETLLAEKRNQSAKKSVFALFSIQNAQIRRVIFVYFLFTVAFAGMEFTLTFTALERFAYSPRQMTQIFLFIGFILIMMQGGVVRRLSPKMGEVKPTVFGLMMGMLAFAILAFAFKLSLFYIALALLAAGSGLVFPLTSTLVSRFSKDNEQGANLGIYRSAGSLARVIGPLSAAFGFWTFGAKMGYLLGAVLVIVPLFLSLKIRQPENVL